MYYYCFMYYLNIKNYLTKKAQPLINGIFHVLKCKLLPKLLENIFFLINISN